MGAKYRIMVEYQIKIDIDVPEEYNKESTLEKIEEYCWELEDQIEEITMKDITCYAKGGKDEA